MGDESMQSGMSGMESAPPGAPGAEGAQAENIIKKLSAYWVIIGAIPFVLFCLVAIPTVLYVRSISTFINAFYCNSKACNSLAEALDKAESAGKPCVDYFDYVCKASGIKLLADRNKEAAMLINPKLVTEKPSNLYLSTYAEACKNNFGSDTHEIILALSESSQATPIEPNNALAKALTFAAIGITTYGVDVLLRIELVHNSPVNTTYDLALQPTPHTYVDVAIGVPDMGDLEYSELLASADAKIEEWVKTTATETIPDDNLVISLGKFYTKFTEFMETCREADFDKAPEIWTQKQLDEVSGTTADDFKWKDLIGFVLPGNTLARFIVMSPTLIREFPKFLQKELNDTTMTPVVFAYAVMLELGIRIMPTLVLPSKDPRKEYWCIRWVDSLIPGLSSIPMAELLQKRWTHSL
ncbi:unnamed protein product, partial [Ixodes hexagonus]